jgi:hypothetical protein
MWSNLARLPALSVRAVISKVPVDDHFSFTIWVSALTIAGLCRSGGGTADRRCGRSLTLQDIVLCVVESAVLIRCRRPGLQQMELTPRLRQVRLHIAGRRRIACHRVDANGHRRGCSRNRCGHFATVCASTPPRVKVCRHIYRAIDLVPHGRIFFTCIPRDCVRRHYRTAGIYCQLCPAESEFTPLEGFRPHRGGAVPHTDVFAPMWTEHQVKR